MRERPRLTAVEPLDTPYSAAELVGDVLFLCAVLCAVLGYGAFGP